MLTTNFRSMLRVEGHGVGLAIVKELVEDVYEGELQVFESELGGARVEARIFSTP